MIATNVIPAQNVQVVTAPTPVVVDDSCKGEPRISIVKVDGEVRTIEIECVCGKVTRLDCVY